MCFLFQRLTSRWLDVARRQVITDPPVFIRVFSEKIPARRLRVLARIVDVRRQILDFQFHATTVHLVHAVHVKYQGRGLHGSQVCDDIKGNNSGVQVFRCNRHRFGRGLCHVLGGQGFLIALVQACELSKVLSSADISGALSVAHNGRFLNPPRQASHIFFSADVTAGRTIRQCSALLEHSHESSYGFTSSDVASRLGIH